MEILTAGTGAVTSREGILQEIAEAMDLADTKLEAPLAPLQ